MKYNLGDWQELQPWTGPGAPFYQFCDALEVKDGENAPPTGWGADHAIQAWGDFWTRGYYRESESYPKTLHINPDIPFMIWHYSLRG